MERNVLTGAPYYAFSNFSCLFLNPNHFFNLNSNCSNLLDTRNLQKQVTKAFWYQNFFWPCTVWINCSSDLKYFANCWPSTSNFESFSTSLEQFLVTESQNNFGNKIPFIVVILDATSTKEQIDKGKVWMKRDWKYSRVQKLHF